MNPAGSSAITTLTATLLLALAGCGDGQETPMTLEDRAEQAAADARSNMDALADRVGTDPEVTQDELSGCIPGRRDSGLDLIYNIAVTTEPGAMDRVLADVVPDYEADGWTVRQRGSDNIVFERDNVTMGARFSDDGTRATVGGSGGCVR